MFSARDSTPYARPGCAPPRCTPLPCCAAVHGRACAAYAHHVHMHSHMHDPPSMAMQRQSAAVHARHGQQRPARRRQAQAGAVHSLLLCICTALRGSEAAHSAHSREGREKGARADSVHAQALVAARGRCGLLTEPSRPAGRVAKLSPTRRKALPKAPRGLSVSIGLPCG